MYRSILLFLLLAVLSCKNDMEKDIIPPDTMQKLIIDVHLAEAYSTMIKDSLHPDRAKNTDSLAVYYKSILQHYKLSEAELVKSINWYKRNPETLDSAYANVIPKLSLLESVYANKKQD